MAPKANPVADPTSANPDNAYVSVGLAMEKVYALIRKFREADFDDKDWDPAKSTLKENINWLDVLGVDDEDFPGQMPMWLSKALDAVALSHYQSQIEDGSLDWRRS